MNTLQGQIKSISTEGSLSLVRVQCGDVLLSCIVIDSKETTDYLQEGHSVSVIFKETEVVLGKGQELAISLQNRIPGTVASISVGKLLSRLELDTSAGKIVSIVTAKAVNELELQEGSEVTAMIKTNEVMLSND